jgi:hypothetical protein
MIPKSGNRFSIKIMLKRTIQTRARRNKEGGTYARRRGDGFAVFPPLFSDVGRRPYVKISSKKLFIEIQDRWSACLL